MRTIRQSLCIMMSICMIITTFATFGFVANAADGFAVDVLVEAEAGVLKKPMESYSDNDASGKKYIAVTDGDRMDEPDKQPSADAAYVFNITKEDNYILWVRTKMVSTGSDSYYLKWDKDTYLQTGGNVSDKFEWKAQKPIKLTAGSHTLSIVRRESKTQIDALFLTADANKMPPLYTSSTTAPTASAAPSTSSKPAGALKSFIIPEEGSVFVEAENTTISADLASVTDSSSASGKKGVVLNVSAKDLTAADLVGAISFEVSAKKTGVYLVWARYAATSDSNDSSYRSFNNEVYSQLTLPATGSADSFSWVSVGTINMNADVPATIRIRPRESGAVLDRFLITNIRAYTPAGVGEIPKPGDEKVYPLPSDAYPKPTIIPPNEHPRLLMRAKDIPTIKANMEKSQNAASKKQLTTFLEGSVSGQLAPPKAGTTTSNYNGSTLAIIEAKAFDYAINKNEASGQTAIAEMLNFLDTVIFFNTQDVTRAMGHTIFTASEVYDWCFPFLNADQKKKIVLGCELIAGQMETKWPPASQGAIVGHAGEAQIQRDLLSFGIATYDEYPDIYNYVAGRYLSEFVETRNYWYTSHSYHQGPSYNNVRYSFDMWANWIFYRMSDQKIFVSDAQYPAYQSIYYRRPDGYVFIEGDMGNDKIGAEATYFRFMQSAWLAGSFYDDPYLKYEVARESPNYASFNYTFSTTTPVQFMLFNNPDLEPRPFTELPKTKYFGSPNGLMVARTGWNEGIKSPDTMVMMKIGERWAANHHHMDAGTFQIYYKGSMTKPAGLYDAYNTEHDANYNKETISHNGLLIYDPNEAPNSNRAVNSGGQKRLGGEPNVMSAWMNNDVYETGKVLGQEFGPDPVTPEYSYISGDITKAYSDKVSEVRRSMLFMPTDNAEAPAAFVVMDKIISKDASFKKTFLLQAMQAPEVNGNVTVLKRDTDGYNGRLTNQTLYPKNANIQTVGGVGKQWFINNKNYIPTNSKEDDLGFGWGRVEISPKDKQKEDYFLNVMYVSDADKDAAINKAELIESEDILGAKILDRVSIFAKSKARLSKDIVFTIPSGSTAGGNKVAVAGIKDGEWTINVGGSEIDRQIATADGGIVYFTAPSGEITLKLTNPSAKRAPVNVVLEKHEGISIKINGKYMYSDVPPTIRNDRTMVPMRAIFESLQAEVNWDPKTKSATAVKGDKTVIITEDSTTAYINGVATELDVPATIINDRFVVPIRFVSEALDAKVDWEATSKTVIITPTMNRGPISQYAIPIVGAKWSSDNGEDQNGYKSYDGDVATRWAAEGASEWITYEFKEVSTVKSIYTLYFSGTARIYALKLYASTDGVNFTQIFDGKTSGKSDEDVFTLDKEVSAKYIKLVGGGNSVNGWNSLHEIEFRSK